MKKTVVITGSTKGIGAATAIRFAKDGYNVVVSGRNEKNGHGVVDKIKANGGEATFIKADVDKEDKVKNLIQEAVKKYGSLDVVVNNAGTIKTSESPLFEHSTNDTFEAMLRTNVWGLYWGMKYAAQEMLKNKKGSIINVASIAGVNGMPCGAQYSATKHAVVALTKSVALEYARQGVRINAIAPGIVDTDILTDEFKNDQNSISSYCPVGRLAQPDEIANAIAFMASDDSPFMTGSIMRVDGGYDAK